MTTRKSNDYKITAVNYYLVEDKTQEEVCKIFKCNPRSLMRWVERYKKDGNVNILIENLSLIKLKRNMLIFYYKNLKIIKPLRYKNYYKILKINIKELDLTITQIFRVIKDNTITLKITRLRPERVKILI